MGNEFLAGKPCLPFHIFRVVLLLGIRPLAVATDAGPVAEKAPDLMTLVQAPTRIDAIQQQGQQEQTWFLTSQEGNQLHSVLLLEQLVLEHVDSDGPSNKAFIETVKPHIWQLQEKIKKDKKSWQDHVNIRAEGVEKCNKKFAEDTAVMNSHRRTYLKRSTAHKECRAEQNFMYKAQNRCKIIYALVKERQKRELRLLKKSSKFPDAKMCSSNDGESYEQWLQRMADEFQEKIKLYKAKKKSVRMLNKETKSKASTCKTKSVSYKNKVKTCNSIGEAMDGAKCREALSLQRACDRNKVCYDMAVKAYKTIEPTARLTEKDMKVDWKSLSRIQCYLGALGNGKAGSSNKKALKKCKEGKIDTKHLDLVYPSLTGMKKCKMLDNYPCTTPYMKKEYIMLGKGPAKCTPCAGISGKGRKGKKDIKKKKKKDDDEDD
mmetsp:Transcript_135062/g.263029  ORF Transcript_135062/g.263029 Transcript_135062/m.263029 type:complete len:433 (-) Transcript_135062:142-1440(-)